MRARGGFTLTSLITGLGLMSIVVLGATAVLSSLNKSSRQVAQHGHVAGLRERFSMAVRQIAICNCHLNSNLTQDDSNDANLVVNTTLTDGSGRIQLTRVREGCAVNDPVVVAVGQNLGEGLIADRIEMSDLMPTGNPNEWFSRWSVVFRSAQEGVTPAPMEITQLFYVDPASAAATPAAARIERCKGPVPGAVGGCPPGMALVGLAGQFGAFCVSRTPHDPTSAATSLPYFPAQSACANFPPPGFGPARICDQNQWIAACKANIDPSFFSGTPEWVDDASNTGSPLYSANNINQCDNPIDDDDTFGGSHFFRCCLR